MITANMLCNGDSVMTKHPLHDKLNEWEAQDSAGYSIAL